MQLGVILLWESGLWEHNLRHPSGQQSALAVRMRSTDRSATLHLVWRSSVPEALLALGTGRHHATHHPPHKICDRQQVLTLENRGKQMDIAARTRAAH